MGVAGVAVRHDGRSASLTAPNGSAQRALLGAALASAGVTAAGMSRLEAHGTGTALGDPTEAGSLAATLCGRASGRASPLAVAAAKASIGHSEPVSGQAGLQRLATALGADVPVFVMGQSAWAEGVGEVLSALALPKRWFVIAQPNCAVSTAEIFADPALTRHTPPITVQAFFSGAGHNDLQDVVLPRYPEVQQAWEWLHQHSPTARMTGSGACVFAALETEESARRIAAEAPDGLRVVVAEGVDRLPEMRVVE